MKLKNICNSLWVMGVLSLAVFCLSSCDRQLDIQSSYDFSLKTLPIPKSIAENETAEIRCKLITKGDFKDNRYTIRYFQTDGKGILKLDNGTVFFPNDTYPLASKVFRLYYTSHSTERQTIDIYIEDSFGKLVQKTFDINNKTK